MTHLTQDDLVLHYYGEDEARDCAAHIAACEICRAEFDALRRVLGSLDQLPVPERGIAYGSEVWERIRGGCVPPTRAKVIAFPRWKALGAIAAMLIAAFFAGYFVQKPRPTVSAGISGPVRERILLVAVGEHLERSQMVLAELVNAGEAESDLAQELLSENRLYRQTALTSGDRQVASLLDELERVLMEIAHSPADAPQPAVERIRERIENDNLLFKVRVVESNIRQKVSPNPGGEIL